MNIFININLRLDDKGFLTNSVEDKIHLRQGDMDGACGPYCVAMALLIYGFVERDKLTSHERLDGRTAIGKFWSLLNRKDALVASGTESTELQDLLHAFSRKLKLKYQLATSKPIFCNAISSIKNGSVVIIDVRSNVEAALVHWVLCIGYHDETILLLDPGLDIQSGQYWNAVLRKNANGTGHFRYQYISGLDTHDVKMTESIDIQ